MLVEYKGKRLKYIEIARIFEAIFCIAKRDNQIEKRLPAMQR